MNTPAYIAIKEDNGNIKAIYNHNNGFFKNLGYYLCAYYDTKEKVDQLINLGSIKSIGENPEPTKAVSLYGINYKDNPEFLKSNLKVKLYLLNTKDFVIEDIDKKKGTIAYHRDNGDDLVIEKFDNEVEYLKFLRNKKDIKYAYIFNKDRWYAINLKNPYNYFTEINKDEVYSI